MSKFSYFFSRNKGKIIGWISFILVVAGACFAIYFLNIMTTKADSVDSRKYSSRNDENAKIIGLDDSDKEDKNEEKEEKVTSSKIKVDIKGSVKHEGVYELDSNKRVVDAIELAGGATSKADLSVTNLSKKLKDEMVIIIYTKDEVKNFVEVKKQEEEKQEKCVITYENVINDACVCDDNTPTNDNKTVNDNEDTTSIISLNKATKEQLMTLTGIGESKALLIIEYRESHNGFQTIEEIKNIKGIGDSIFEKIKNRITV